MLILQMRVITREGCRQLQGVTARKRQPPSAGRGQQDRPWGAPPCSLICRWSGVTTSWDFSVLSQKQEHLRERGSFRNNKELSWRGIHSLASRHECSLLSKPHVFSFRKWDKTQNLEPGQALSSVHQSPIRIPARMPIPLLWVQCHQTQSPWPLKQSRWKGCALCAPFSFLAQGTASPHPSFPWGFTEPSLGRR